MLFNAEDLLGKSSQALRAFSMGIREKRRELGQLRHILGSKRRSGVDHLAATGAAANIGLSDSIVETVAASADSVKLCRAVLSFDSKMPPLNFEKLRLAAPDIIAADRLDRSWATWHAYRTTEEAAIYADDVKRLLKAGTPVGPLLGAMAEVYFNIVSYPGGLEDFSLLLPPSDDDSAPMVEVLRLLVGTHIAVFFRAAAQAGLPNRPDLFCRLHRSLRQLTSLLLRQHTCDEERTLELSAQIAMLRMLLGNPLLIRPNLDLEIFCRNQWKEHFKYFAVPAERFPTPELPQLEDM